MATRSLHLFRFLLICLIIIHATMHMDAAENTKIREQTNGSSSNSIQSLNARIKALDERVDFWNKVIVVVPSAAVIFSISAIISQWILIKRQKEVAAAQTELIAEKDRVALEDSKAKDVLIGNAKEEAGRANEAAGKANERAGKLEKEAADARLEVANINKMAAQANDAAAQANLRAEELNKQNLVTEQSLEREKRQRLELEKSLAPRSIAFMIGLGDTGQPFHINRLISFSGMGVHFQYLPDGEARRTASSLKGILKTAQWNILSDAGREALEASFFDGIIIFVKAGRNTGDAQQDRALAAADTLLSFLLSQKIFARIARIPANTKEAEFSILTPDTLLVSVGFKPAPYFEPAIMKELTQPK